MIQFIRHACFLLILLIFPIFIFSQIKIEKETKVKKKDVPLISQTFIDSCQFHQVKWYKEVSQRGKSYEAKGMRNDHLYSIEFDCYGNIQDVEITIAASELKPAVHDMIQKELTKKFTKFKIKKIQIQWLGRASTLRTLVKTGESPDEYCVNYELIIRGKKEGPKRYYEALFDHKGNLINILQLVKHPTKNLELDIK
jgi:hypothetical protein